MQVCTCRPRRLLPETREQLELDEPHGRADAGSWAGAAWRPAHEPARSPSRRPPGRGRSHPVLVVHHAPDDHLAGIVYTRFDASVGTSLVLVNGRTRSEPRSRGGGRDVPRALRSRPCTWCRIPRRSRSHARCKPGTCPSKSDTRPRDREDPCALCSSASTHPSVHVRWSSDRAPGPRRAYIGRAGLPPDLQTANLKHVEVQGGEVASRSRSCTTWPSNVWVALGLGGGDGHGAAIARTRRTRRGVRRGARPEAALDPQVVLDALADRGIHVEETERSRP